jgi:hypothetical protein
MSYEHEVKLAFESNASTATLLATLLRKHFGDEVFFWDPATIYLELRDEFGAEAATPAMDRIAATQVVITTDAFFRRPDAFLNICNTLASGEPSFTLFDPVTTEEAAWAIVEVSLLREMEPLAYPIKEYIRTILAQDGYTDDYPDVFDAILGKKPPSAYDIKELAQRTLHDDQKDAVEIFIDDQLRDLISQFNRIPGMAGSIYAILKEKEIEELSIG